MQPVTLVGECTHITELKPTAKQPTTTTMREFKSKDFWRAVLAELVGMTLFIFLSISTAIGNKNSSNPDQEVKVSLAFGLAIATLAQSLGHISGAHLNPAVTLGMLASCQISIFKAVMYIIAQMLGSALASGIVYGARPSTTDALGLNSLNGVTPSQGVGIELLATFQLVLCVIAVTDKRRRDVTGSAPLAIGLSVCLGHLAAISYTGCGINPARSFGPALILKDFTDHWVYWVGPMCGGVAAALIYDFLLAPKFDDFPDRMKVLVSGPVGDYDVNGGNDAATVEMTTK
ncbi:LOW QUALITY PROTEIN: aquaporin-1-like [Antennarius striatus]|uniref:LOW QUALITY PROTEIN: aquaporin-1-like n=1 Tax=Antennarius striatus TaxID=241820 RepID=UPI0035B34A8F